MLPPDSILCAVSPVNPRASLLVLLALDWALLHTLGWGTAKPAREPVPYGQNWNARVQRRAAHSEVASKHGHSAWYHTVRTLCAQQGNNMDIPSR